MEALDIIEFIGGNLKTLLLGAVIVEAVVEIIGDFLPSKYSVKGARALGVIIGILVAFCFHISIVNNVDGSMTIETVIGTVIAGVIMSRSSEWVHSLVKSITSIPAAIATVTSANKTVTKEVIVAATPQDTKTESQSQ